MNTATSDAPTPTPTPPITASFRQASDTPAGSGLPDAIRTFLAPARIAVLATIDPDGSPHQAVVWYALEGDLILVNSRRGRHWPANVERDPNVHLAVYESARPTHWIGLKGHARLLREGDAAMEDIRALARRYDGDPDAYRGQLRVTFAIDVDRTFEYGSRS